MNLLVNRNLALETPPEVPRPAPESDPRAELAAQFIPAGARVLDLSGAKALKPLLPNGCGYQACDIAAKDFPTKAAAKSDIIVMLGALEQISDVESLFTHLRFCKQDVVLSYCPTNLSEGRNRAALGFVNHLSFYDLAMLFDRYGFRIACTAPVDDAQMLMRLTPIDRLLERLDTWFARTQDDVLMYGRGRKNVVHLGDWLIDQFPMSRAIDDAPLQIGPETGVVLPLDHTIQLIQRHKQVYSARLHPLLCALTSAELAAYTEQPSEQPDINSGKFRSMLIDIFGRSYPEKQFFMVDRDAVKSYKARVHRNVAKVGERIDAILRNVAVASA